MKEPFAGMQENLVLNRITKFTKDGNRLFVSLQETEKQSLKSSSNTVKVDVWSYFDPIIQSKQLKDRIVNYSGIIDITSRIIIQLESWNTSIIANQFDIKNEYVLLSQTNGDKSESHWNKMAKPSIFLLYLKDGSKKEISNASVSEIRPHYWQLSPNEKFVIYFDPTLKKYFSYEMATGLIRNIKN